MRIARLIGVALLLASLLPTKIVLAEASHPLIRSLSLKLEPVTRYSLKKMGCRSFCKKITGFLA